ncbi:eCIS core domain-containing protein [Falsiroseomonas sp. E2-1-a4]|uniref:eCIS core domain-containing protein n=1 Tax=Falsiroseomonas sp. E2-1-a4 TaxID=3239299 RepID=UPI003F32908A
MNSRVEPSAARGKRQDAPPPGRAAPEAAAVETAGNQDLQQALAAGRLRRWAGIGAPGDAAEDAADRAAAAVLAGRSACSCGGAREEPCPACQRRSSLTLRRQPADGGATPSGVATARLTGGKPLSRGERSLFEPGFSADFSDLRLHTGPEAAAAAGAVRANAFALGRDIVFGRDQYQPGTSAGRQLLAHELAHVALGHTGLRRQGEDGGTPDAPDAGTPVAAPAAEFDPCAENVAEADNARLLALFVIVERYLNGLIAQKRRGEDRYFDYANLHRRLLAARSQRARQGHAWLSADLTAVPAQLYKLEPNPIGDLILIYRVAGSVVATNPAPGRAIFTTPGQLAQRLADDAVPEMDLPQFFDQQDRDAPQRPYPMEVPKRSAEQLLPHDDPADPFGLRTMPLQDPFAPPTAADQLGFPSYGLGPFGMQAAPIIGQNISPLTRALSVPFNRPVVTGGPYGFGTGAVGGFRSDWQGDIGEALYATRDVPTFNQIQDLNRAVQNFTLYDFYDPRTQTFESVKTQLPTAPGGPPSLGSVQEAVREVFGNADPAKRTQALQMMQNAVDPTLTLDKMLLGTRFAVNPETVPAAQDSVEAAIRRGQMDYEVLLSAFLRQQPISVQHSRGPQKGQTVSYTDFATLNADFKAKHITQARYRDAVGQLAQRARAQVVPTGAGAENRLRPLIDFRQRYDFSNAADYAGLADTPANRRLARAGQQNAFERIGVPELLEVQTKGMRPVLGRSTMLGGGLGLGTSAIMGAPHLAETWDTDPYAGRRYLTNLGLSATSGAGQATAEQYMRIRIAQGGLDYAASRAAAGRSIAPVAWGAPAARLGGGTALGGVVSGGVTAGSMWLDERYFDADYTPIDYSARVTRAAVIGSGASLMGALAAGGTTALLAGGGGAAGCTVVLPVVGTVACGAVGGAAGFVVGVGSYALFDWLLGDVVETEVRDVMGEAGCVGR